MNTQFGRHFEGSLLEGNILALRPLHVTGQDQHFIAKVVYTDQQQPWLFSSQGGGETRLS